MGENEWAAFFLLMERINSLNLPHRKKYMLIWEYAIENKAEETLGYFTGLFEAADAEDWEDE